MSSTAMQALDDLERQLGEYAASCRADALRRRISELEAMMSGPGFWDDQVAAQRIIAELKQAKNTVEPHDALVDSLAACRELLELAEADGDQSEIDEVLAEITELQQRFEQLEIAQVLDGPYDACDIYLSIQPGAGGTDACDWAEMLVRMYTNYCVNNGYKVELLDHQPAAEAGIKSATLQIRGPMAYGYFKSEMGTHRLVRMSPFNSSGTRETSFAAVEVTPELPDADIVDIETMDPKLFRLDTYRSSGAGGQHINKTDSAVRITHLTSGIVVSCQTERSQQQNRLKCWKVMQAKLQQLEEAERLQELQDLGAERGTIGWGHQIRSYVLQPQQLVTDLRTRLKESNAMGVLQGDLQPFIDSYLRWRLAQRRIAGRAS